MASYNVRFFLITHERCVFFYGYHFLLKILSFFKRVPLLPSKKLMLSQKTTNYYSQLKARKLRYEKQSDMPQSINDVPETSRISHKKRKKTRFFPSSLTRVSMRLSIGLRIFEGLISLDVSLVHGKSLLD